jgi:hypothetical protein
MLEIVAAVTILESSKLRWSTDLRKLIQAGKVRFIVHTEAMDITSFKSFIAFVGKVSTARERSRTEVLLSSTIGGHRTQNPSGH